MALYKRPDSKFWWMKFVFDGRPVQQSTKCSNKRDAQTVESAYRMQLALGKIGIEPMKKAPTFEQAANDFLSWAKTEHAEKPRSYKRYDHACQVLREHFGKMKVDRIQKKHVEDFIVWRGEQKSKKTGEFITRGTINLEIVVLKMVLSRLLDAKVLRESPAKKVKRLKANERSFYVISEEEEKLYLLACPQPLQDIACLMLETGMRPTEIYELKREHVFLEKNSLKVAKGKTKSSIRKISLSDKAGEVLRRRLDRFKGENLFPQADQDFANPTKSVDKMHRDTVAGLSLHFRLYDCRHTFATRALESDTDLLTLASMLGHAGLGEVTRYAHPSETRKSDAIQKMQEKRRAKAV